MLHAAIIGRRIVKRESLPFDLSHNVDWKTSSSNRFSKNLFRLKKKEKEKENFPRLDLSQSVFIENFFSNSLTRIFYLTVKWILKLGNDY